MPTELERRARKGCTCEGCGQDYYGDLIVPDEVWAEIADSRELLCGTCITDAIVLRGIWTAARVTDIDALQAQQPGAQAVAQAPNRVRTEVYEDGKWRTLCVYGFSRPDTQPPSIPEPSVEDVGAAAASIWEVSPHDMMASAGHPVDWTSQPESIKRDYRKKARAALTTYTARLRERIGV